MAFDGIVTTAMVAELSKKLTGAKIDKIYQPAADEIILNIRSGKEKLFLYISAGTNNAGLYLINDKGTNPQNPPAFCMLLRKHLQSARIHEIKQIDSERIVEIHTDAVNELGFNVNHKLVIEIMGKHSNILLIDLKTDKILDCIKRISGDINRYRQTLPGLPYVAPPSHDKISYFGLEKSDFLNAMEALSKYKPDKALMNAVQGLSPAAATELCNRAAKKLQLSSHSPEASNSAKNFSFGAHTFSPTPHDTGDVEDEIGNDGAKAVSACDNEAPSGEFGMRGSVAAFADALFDELNAAVKFAVQNSGAHIYIDDDGTLKEFHVIPLAAYESSCKVQYFDTVSEACLSYFEGRSSSNRLRQKSNDMRHHVSSVLDKMFLKKQRLSEDLLKAEDSEKYRLYGELLTASLHSVKNGRTEAEVSNYYDGTTITIALNPRYSPAQNAQRYFKKYAKSRTAIVEKKKQLQETDAEISYLDSVLTFIDNSHNDEDIDDIRTELIENGVLKRKPTKEKTRKSKISPVEYHSSSGKRILVGRNNKENDALTFKTAASNDIWLHTKDIPGSHVILFTEGKEPDESDIFEAAAIAAAHSKAKLSGNVPVDYVTVKHVKKPNGSKPGYVIFTQNRTVYVDPAKL